MLVIDDQEFPYRKLFQRDGYTVEKWNDVKNLTDIETGRYDLILLDLKGVGRKESSDEGLGLLKHIRSSCPAQLVVAYSNSEFPVDAQPFFRMADEVLPKTADYAEFKRTVDALLDERFSLGFYLRRIENELADYAGELPKLSSKAERAILSGKLDVLADYLRRVEDTKAVERATKIARVALLVLKIWSS